MFKEDNSMYSSWLMNMREFNTWLDDMDKELGAVQFLQAFPTMDDAYRMFKVIAGMSSRSEFVYMVEDFDIETDDVSEVVAMMNEYIAFGMAKEEEFRAYISRGKLLTARLNGVLIGVVSLVPFNVAREQRYTLSDLTVRDKFRNLGVARALVTTALSSVNDGDTVYVNSFEKPSGWDAEKLFRSFGFKELAEMKDFYTGDCDSGIYKCPNRRDKCNCKSTKYSLVLNRALSGVEG